MVPGHPDSTLTCPEIFICKLFWSNNTSSSNSLALQYLILYTKKLKMAEAPCIPTHVLIFPFPLQGHMNPMFKLSELLCLAGIHVTYLITVQNHSRLLQNTDIVSRYAKYPGFRFQMLPENVSHGNAQPIKIFLQLYESLKTVQPFLRDVLVGRGQARPVTCLITDGLMKFTLDVGEETRVPVVYFRTASAASFWAYFCSDKIVEGGECPFEG